MKLTIAAVLGISALGLASASGQPFPAGGSSTPPVGKAYVYKTTEKGGLGDVRFQISKLPPAGDYMMSFAANFKQMGSVGSPIEFSCWMQTTESNNIGQSTTTDIGIYHVGVSAQAFVQVTSGIDLGVYCGSSSSSGWKWDNAPLKITLVRLDAETTGKTASPAVVGALAVDRAANAGANGGH